MAEGGQIEDDGLNEALQNLLLDEEFDDDDASSYSAMIRVWKRRATGGIENEHNQKVDAEVPAPEEPVTADTLIPIIENALSAGVEIIESELYDKFAKTLKNVESSEISAQSKRILMRNLKRIDIERQRLTEIYYEIRERIDSGESDYKILRRDYANAKDFHRGIQLLYLDFDIVEQSLNALEWRNLATLFFETASPNIPKLFHPESHLLVFGRDYGTLFNEMQRKIESYNAFVMLIREEFDTILDRWRVYPRVSGYQTLFNRLLDISETLDNREPTMKRFGKMTLRIPKHDEHMKVKKAIATIIQAMGELYSARMALHEVDTEMQRKISQLNVLSTTQQQIEPKSPRLRRGKRARLQWDSLMRRRSRVNYHTLQLLGAIDVSRDNQALRQLHDESPEDLDESDNETDDDDEEEWDEEDDEELQDEYDEELQDEIDEQDEELDDEWDEEDTE